MLVPPFHDVVAQAQKLLWILSHQFDAPVGWVERDIPENST